MIEPRLRHVSVVTLFPEMFTALTDWGVVGRAFKQGVCELSLVNPRDYATDIHGSVDDRPYGGGPRHGNAARAVGLCRRPCQAASRGRCPRGCNDASRRGIQQPDGERSWLSDPRSFLWRGAMKAWMSDLLSVQLTWNYP